LPEIKVLDFTSENSIDAIKILNEIHADPWLHNGGIIAIAANNAEAQKLEEKKDSNILVIQTVKSFHENFARLLRILWSNQHFLFNRGIQDIQTFSSVIYIIQIELALMTDINCKLP